MDIFRLVATLLVGLLLFASPPAFAPLLPPEVAEVVVIKAPDKPNTYCLAKAIYFEARGQSMEGKVAVAMVVLNRLRYDGYPDVCHVVFDKCQFSWMCDDRELPRVALDLRGIHEKAEWNDELVLAKMLLTWYTGNQIEDVSHGATSFHTKEVDQGLPGTTAVIGDHVFKRVVYR